MAQCAYCEAETELYESIVPVCVMCADEPPQKRGVKAHLIRDLREATGRANVANLAFWDISRDIPSGLPHPDGTQRVHDASRELSAARYEMMRAYNRLDDFLKTGIVPKDLKRNW
jgi:hypothetical protein